MRVRGTPTVTELRGAAGLDIRVLGPLLVRRGATPGRLAAAKPRKVLALLLMYAERVVPARSLIREVWHDAPPPSARTTLQTYILQVRRMLRDVLDAPASQVAAEVLLTRSDGYLLRVADGRFDLHEFERLSAAGRAALASGDSQHAARSLRQALDLWQGPALVDVPTGPLLEVQTRRLEEDRLTALQQRIEADLRLGRHHDVLSELTALAAQHPLHENVAAQHMLALYRVGRRTDALKAFHRLRSLLVADLGLEPSPPIQRLHTAILCADPELERAPRGAAMILDRLVGEPLRAVGVRPGPLVAGTAGTG